MRTTSKAILLLILLGGCAAVGGQKTTVRVSESDEFLKLRAGPGLGFRIVLGLPNGTELLRRDCVTEVGQLWCRVSLAQAPSVTGYVAADYLTGG
ncbi:SH3 domain-containing protein [Pseudooceanicola sp. 216_PA32_1]|uniref:SH3 domain-containing protein n=2 Tax=Pseudooceanicola pacificus TaxID=2676438 RepID=A0A844W4P7_9RHOB|nr:SH3 domain-containing protein [Pseudooceanicola pacificus]MWB77781.1 SH3 domain-containing protein [Pseudooceanicola pacificus]